MADGRGADCNSETAVRSIRKVLFISAGASHSVALLCKLNIYHCKGKEIVLLSSMLNTKLVIF